MAGSPAQRPSATSRRRCSRVSSMRARGSPGAWGPPAGRRPRPLAPGHRAAPGGSRPPRAPRPSARRRRGRPRPVPARAEDGRRRTATDRPCRRRRRPTPAREPAAERVEPLRQNGQFPAESRKCHRPTGKPEGPPVANDVDGVVPSLGQRHHGQAAQRGKGGRDQCRRPLPGAGALTGPAWSAHHGVPRTATVASATAIARRSSSRVAPARAISMLMTISWPRGGDPAVGRADQDRNTAHGRADQENRCPRVGRRCRSSRPRHAAVRTKSQGQAGAIVVIVPLEPRYLSAPSST